MTEFSAYLPAEYGHGKAPDALIIRPTWFKVTDRGGSYRASFEVTGAESALWGVLEWLGRPIHVIDEWGADVWRGKITDVDLTIAGMAINISYEGMYNRVNVLYSYDAADGSPQTAETGWASDDLSVSAHGERELIYTMPDTYSADAVRKRDNILAEFKRPVGVPAMSQVGAGATLTARGYFQFVEWKYHKRLEGRIEYAYTPTRHVMVGWQRSGNGFNWFFGKLHDLDAGITSLIEGNYIHVIGSVHNGGVYEVTGGVSGDAPVTFVSDQIALEPEDDIRLDTNAPVGFIDAGFRAEEVITIAGSTFNDGAWPVEHVNDNYYMDTAGYRQFQNEWAGNLLTLVQGVSVQLNNGSGIMEELHDARDTNVTITALGYGIAQRFTAPGTWEAQRVAVTVRKVGNPTDDFVIRIYGDNNGDIDPNNKLGELTYTGADLALVDEQRWFEFPTPIQLTEGVAYWLHVSRTGALSDTDFYVVGVNDNSAPDSNGFMLANTDTWYHYNMVLPFLLYATEDTKDQIDRILAEADQFGGRVAWDFDQTGVRTNQYQDGRSRADSILEDLLDLGGPNGRRLIVMDDPNGNYIISEEPDRNATKNRPLIWSDGRITSHSGGPLPSGQLPVAQWVDIAELQAGFSDVTGDLSPLYVMSAALDIDNGKQPMIYPRTMDIGDRIEKA